LLQAYRYRLISFSGGLILPSNTFVRGGVEERRFLGDMFVGLVEREAMWDKDRGCIKSEV
jgi:hypothetical protein